MASPCAMKVKVCSQLMRSSIFRCGLVNDYFIKYGVRYASSNQLFNSGSLKWKPVKIGGLVAIGVATVFVGSRRFLPMKSDVSQLLPTKSIVLPGDESGLQLTLYQFQSCPFCSKVRAYLDYRGLSYDIIEVNYLRRREMKKWAMSRQVPLLVARHVDSDISQQINESSLIPSVLESYLHDPSDPLPEVMNFYPSHETPGRLGKMKREYHNKYFIMYKDEVMEPDTLARLQEERQWRAWVDDHLVRLLPPNIYRSMPESFDSVRHFESMTEGGRSMAVDRYLYVYAGAPAMFLLGKMLKRKYNLHDDVRVSLYNACNQWVKAVGKERPFLGGQEPNMADVAVYGTLNAIEGCRAFSDLEAHTHVKPWYDRMKVKVDSHAGASHSSRQML